MNVERAGNRSHALVCILSLCIQIIVFNESIFFWVCRTLGHSTPSVCRPLRYSALGSLLRYSITSIDPIRIHVDGGGQVIDVGLKGLAANLALEITDARLLLDRDADGLFVVAEKALERCWEFLLLWRKLV